MGFFDIFRKKTVPERKGPAQGPQSREDLFRALMEQMAQKSPSHHFVSGGVFDMVRQQHGTFEQLLRSRDVAGVLGFFANAYITYCDTGGAGLAIPGIINVQYDDTDPRMWNADIFPLNNGDYAALCFMPVNDEAVEARIIGIILSQSGDGYYYCMLNKDASALFVRLSTDARKALKKQERSEAGDSN